MASHDDHLSAPNNGFQTATCFRRNFTIILSCIEAKDHKIC